MPRKESTDKPRGSKRRRARSRKWLSDLDSVLRNLSLGPKWLRDPSFMFEKLPVLPPDETSETESDGLPPMPDFYPPGLEQDEPFQQVISTMEKKISDHNEASAVLEGLSSERRRELVTLLVDLQADFENHTNHEHERRRVAQISREVARRQRGLVTRIQKASSALEGLLKYASDLDPMLAGKFKLAAQECLQILQGLDQTRSPEEWAEVRDYYNETRPLPEPEHPGTLAMIECFLFFHDQCQLPKDESEVRTAIVRNALWADWVKPVEFAPESTYPDVTKGCTAVRKAVERFPE